MKNWTINDNYKDEIQISISDKKHLFTNRRGSKVHGLILQLSERSRENGEIKTAKLLFTESEIKNLDSLIHTLQRAKNLLTRTISNDENLSDIGESKERFIGGK